VDLWDPQRRPVVSGIGVRPGLLSCRTAPRSTNHSPRRPTAITRPARRGCQQPRRWRARRARAPECPLPPAPNYCASRSTRRRSNTQAQLPKGPRCPSPGTRCHLLAAATTLRLCASATMEKRQHDSGLCDNQDHDGYHEQCEADVEPDRRPPEPATGRKQFIARQAETAQEQLSHSEADPAFVRCAVPIAHHAERTRAMAAPHTYATATGESSSQPRFSTRPSWSRVPGLILAAEGPTLAKWRASLLWSFRSACSPSVCSPLSSRLVDPRGMPGRFSSRAPASSSRARASSSFRQPSDWQTHPSARRCRTHRRRRHQSRLPPRCWWPRRWDRRCAGGRSRCARISDGADDSVPLYGLAVEPGDLPNAGEGSSVAEGAVGAPLVVVAHPVWQRGPTGCA
jgi:hypothetical protein